MRRDRTSAVISRRKPLSKGQFEQICSGAARNSTSCDQYIQRVLKNLCRYLGIADQFEGLIPAEKANRENTQVTVITLYHLLEEKCRYDFDVEKVLNSCSDVSDWAYH